MEAPSEDAMARTVVEALNGLVVRCCIGRRCRAPGARATDKPSALAPWNEGAIACALSRCALGEVAGEATVAATATARMDMLAMESSALQQGAECASVERVETRGREQHTTRVRGG